MICDICGKEGARIRRVSRSYGKGKNLLVIEKIPMVTCPHCGESYFTAETLHEIERIKLHGPSLATERRVPVATYHLKSPDIGPPFPVRAGVHRTQETTALFTREAKSAYGRVRGQGTPK